MFTKVLGWVLTVVPVLPSLVTDIENLWKGTPKSGAQKWISVEQALSGSISTVADEVSKLAPAGTSTEAIATALSKFSKDVNDAFVTLANDLQLFPHAGQPAVNSAPAAAAKS